MLAPCSGNNKSDTINAACNPPIWLKFDQKIASFCCGDKIGRKLACKISGRNLLNVALFDCGERVDAFICCLI
jgi:hypothetical protein